jgi:hypothetical protein
MITRFDALEQGYLLFPPQPLLYTSRSTKKSELRFSGELRFSALLTWEGAELDLTRV